MGKNDGTVAEAVADFAFGSEGVQAGQSEDSLVLDLNAVEEKSFENLPKGSYQAVVDELEFTESGSGNPMIKVVYKVCEGEFTDRKLYDFWVLRGNGADFGLVKLKKFISRVCPEINMAGFNPKTFAEEGLAIGKLCTIVVGLQKQTKGEYAGTIRNTVKDVEAAASMF